jgi:hypothetical protein
MLGLSTCFAVVMYRYARSIDLVCCGHVSVCLEYLPRRSCIGMLGVSTWEVMYRYAKSIDLGGHISVC